MPSSLPKSPSSALVEVPCLGLKAFTPEGNSFLAAYERLPRIKPEEVAAIEAREAEDAVRIDEHEHEAERLGFTLEEYWSVAHLPDDEAQWCITLRRLKNARRAGPGEFNRDEFDVHDLGLDWDLDNAAGLLSFLTMWGSPNRLHPSSLPEPFTRKDVFDLVCDLMSGSPKIIEEWMRDFDHDAAAVLNRRAR